MPKLARFYFLVEILLAGKLMLAQNPPYKVYGKAPQPSCESHFNRLTHAKSRWDAFLALEDAREEVAKDDFALLEMIYRRGGPSTDPYLSASRNHQPLVPAHQRFFSRIYQQRKLKMISANMDNIQKILHREDYNRAIAQAPQFLRLFQEDFYPEFLSRETIEQELFEVQKWISDFERMLERLEAPKMEIIFFVLDSVVQYRNIMRRSSFVRKIQDRIDHQQPVYSFLLEEMIKEAKELRLAYKANSESEFLAEKITDSFGLFQTIVTDPYFLEATLVNADTFYLFPKFIDFIKQSILQFRLLGKQSLVSEGRQAIKKIDAFFERIQEGAFHSKDLNDQSFPYVQREIAKLRSIISQFQSSSP